MSAWFGRDDQIADDGQPAYGESDQQEEREDDSCPMGGEHEVQEIRAATQRRAMLVYCAKCREEFKPEVE